MKATAHTGALWLFALFGLAWGAALQAAVFYVETFDMDDAGWLDRDAGAMLASHAPGTGLGPGSLGGTFAEQDVPVPELDAFRIVPASSGGAFTGDYYDGAPGFLAWEFSFYAEHVLPSLLMVSFDAGGTLFNRLVTAQVGGVGQWYTISVPLIYDADWLGGTALAFADGLADVGYIDIQISRSGIGGQSYYIDNFELMGAGNNGASAIPEPNTIALLGLAGALLWRVRRGVSPALEERG
ncbi:MAG TPA: PEP-CTERM sorting domain-containing protein [Kiritimatiellia bacterium]|mgnify:CR=1 FL=1|nr:PEP-CTERM sorting domain-containing protein [Kiritimatiellia bacterium]